MKNKFLVFSFLITFCSVLIAQIPDWQFVTQAGGTGGDYGIAISMDDDGNSYLTGSFQDVATFGSYTLTSNGESDIFVAKMDAEGNWIWAFSAGGFDYDRGTGLDLDNEGDIYVTGVFRYTLTFGSYTITSEGYDDIFVAKIDNDGNCLWISQAGGSNSVSVDGITIDDTGNSYVTGDFSTTATFGNIVLNGYMDIYVAKLDSSGNWLWATNAEGVNNYTDYSRSIGLDSLGNCYITGAITGTVMFGDFSLTSPILNSWGIFIAKIDQSGNWLWAICPTGNQHGIGTDLVIDDNGFIYTTGYFENNAIFGAFSLTSNGWNDLFISKCDSNGNWVWANNAGGGSDDKGLAISIDQSGHNFITGYFKETAIFDTISIISNGSRDIFVTEVDTNGNWLWSIPAGGIGNDSGYGIALDNYDKAYVTGSFRETAIFGSHSLVSYGEPDIFFAKIDTISISAGFVADTTYGYKPLTVNFSDLSIGNILSWQWDFQNDGNIDSYEQNPSFTYIDSGIYTVSLTVSNVDSTDTEIKEDYIVVEEPLIADFEGNVTTGEAPLEVQFTDLSEDFTGVINSWQWDFQNDGVVDSYLQNPIFIYTESGVYSVALTVNDSFNTDTEIKEDYILVLETLNADFEANETSGALPFEVQFTDLSTGYIIGWMWDFNGDGTIDSNVQNPNYIYEEMGVYTVSLTVTDGNDNDTETKVDYIEVMGTNSELEIIPIDTMLYQNHPNPFNPTTNIMFNIKENEIGLFSIYNTKGQLIESQQFNTGHHIYYWDASKSSSGVYLYKLKTDNYSKVNKMLLLK